MENTNAGTNMQGNEMTILDLPTECWCFFVPSERVLMMRVTSVTVKEKMDNTSASVEVYLNMKSWYEERRSNERFKRKMILDKVGALREKYRITKLGLMNFGMTDKNLSQLTEVLEKCEKLECLELAHNDFGAGLKDLFGIGALNGLTTLNLKHVNRSGCFTVCLGDIVRQFPKLVYLCLQGNYLGLKRGGTEGVPERPALKYLSLKENSLRGDGFACVREVVIKCPGLTELDLSQNSFGSGEVDMLVGMFSRCKILSTLNFEGNDMDHEADLESTLATALSPLESLTDLNLKDNRLGGFLHMGVVLGRCSDMKYLDLGLARIGDRGATTLAGVLVGFRELRMLNVSTNGLGAAGTEAIAGGLVSCPELHGLIMSNNEVGERGAEALAGVVGKLKFLTLSKCGLGVRGCQALMGLAFEKLDDLDMSQNAMEVNGVKALAEAAGRWPMLRTLSISGNMLGARGMHAAVRVLKEATGLTSLDLSRNGIQDDGVEILTEGLAACGQLRELVLSSNDITDAGATSLAGVLPRCTTLTELFISYNEKIGAAGVRALREAEEGSALTVDVRKRLWTRPVGV